MSKLSVPKKPAKEDAGEATERTVSQRTGPRARAALERGYRARAEKAAAKPEGKLSAPRRPRPEGSEDARPRERVPRRSEDTRERRAPAREGDAPRARPPHSGERDERPYARRTRGEGESRGERPAGRQGPREDRAPYARGERPAGRPTREREAGREGGRPRARAERDTRGVRGGPREAAPREAERYPAKRGAREDAGEQRQDQRPYARGARDDKPAFRREAPAARAPRKYEDDRKPATKPFRESRKDEAREVAAPARPRGEGSGVRVSKLMTERGLCSRREADEYIERGWVFVNGAKVTELGTRVSPEAEVTLSPKAQRAQFERVTILLHKPVGYVSGQAEDGYEPAVTLVSEATQYRPDGGLRFQPQHLKHLAPAGRLDIDSTGLLVLTQDGRIAKMLVGDKSKVEKEYLVRVEGRLIENGLELLNHGLSLDEKPLRPAKVSWQNEHQLRFVLREGRKRQIRRMCELVGLRVVGLKRVRIGKVPLGDLPVGQWRFLKEDESFD